MADHLDDSALINDGDSLTQVETAEEEGEEEEEEETVEFHIITTITEDGISTAVEVKKAELNATSSNLLATLEDEEPNNEDSDEEELIVIKPEEAVEKKDEEPEPEPEHEPEPELEPLLEKPEPKPEPESEAEPEPEREAEQEIEPEAQADLEPKQVPGHFRKLTEEDYADLSAFNNTGITEIANESDAQYDESFGDQNAGESEEDEYDVNEDEEQEDEEEDDDEEEEGNNNVVVKKTGKGYPDHNPLKVVGKTKLSLAEAKLFGLLNKDGEVDLNQRRNALDKDKPKASNMKHAKEMSKPKDLTAVIAAVGLEEEKLKFKPEKSKEANAAMRNPKCGYDFLDNLNDGKDFMTRLQMQEMGTGVKVKKGIAEALEKDYEYSHDKLQCPQCKKEQSYDEFSKKKRECSQCQKKFTKLNVSSGIGFMQKNKQREQERLAKIQKLDDEMYGTLGGQKMPQKLALPTGGGSADNIPDAPQRANRPKREKNTPRNTNGKSGGEVEDEAERMGNVQKILRLDNERRESAIKHMSKPRGDATYGASTIDLKAGRAMPADPVLVAEQIATKDKKTWNTIGAQLHRTVGGLEPHPPSAPSSSSSSSSSSRPPSSSSSRRPLSATSSNIFPSTRAAASKGKNTTGGDRKEDTGSKASKTISLPAGREGSKEKKTKKQMEKASTAVDEENELMTQKFAKLIEI